MFVKNYLGWRDLIRPLVAGLLVGVALLQVPGSCLLIVAGSALLIVSVTAAGIGCAIVRSIIFSLGVGLCSGYWIPAALKGLGATPVEAVLGLGLATMWSAVPHSMMVAAPLGALAPRSQWIRLAAAVTSVAIADAAWLGFPGSVPWTLWGYAWVDCGGLSQLAAVGRLPLVSGSVAATGWVVGELISGDRAAERLRLPLALLSGVIATAVIGLPFAQKLAPRPRSDTDQIRIVGVQPNLPRQERLHPRLEMQRANLRRMIRFSTAAVQAVGTERPLVMVWPESSIIVEGNESELLQRIQREVATLNVKAVIGLTIAPTDRTADSVLNVIRAYDGRGSTVGEVVKTAAVPAIEGVPDSWVAGLFGRFIGRAGAGATVHVDSTVRPLPGGEGSTVLLCFEALFPRIAEARRPTDPRVILNLADDSWIDDEIPSRQLVAILRFRAIEQQLPAVRVAQGGLSGSYDRFGQVVETIEENQYGHLDLDVPRLERAGLVRRLLFLVLPLGAAALTYVAFPWIADRLWRFRQAI